MSNCNRDVNKMLAEAYRSMTINLFGINMTDKCNLAEISLQNSINEISIVENKAKVELQQLVNKVKSLDPVRQKVSLHEVLRRSRVLRATLLLSLRKKRLCCPCQRQRRAIASVAEKMTLLLLMPLLRKCDKRITQTSISKLKRKSLYTHDMKSCVFKSLTYS